MAEVVVFGVVATDVILRVQHIPVPGDHVNAEALGWRIGGSSANVACGLSTAGHHEAYSKFSLKKYSPTAAR